MDSTQFLVQTSAEDLALVQFELYRGGVHVLSYFDSAPPLNPQGALQGTSPPAYLIKSTLHPTIFWEMVKFVDLCVLYFSLVLPREPTWVP